MTLTHQESATIARALSAHAQERGPLILGSQLGLLVSGAIRPRATLRDLGGIRQVASEDLRDQLQLLQSSLDSPDLVYEIKQNSSPPPRVSAPDVPEEVAGTALWRYFSNPKIPCKLFATSSGVVYVGRFDAPTPAGTKELTRPDSEEFRALAKEYADQQLEPMRSTLNGVLTERDFYNTWIASLRQLRTGEMNLVRQWEALRTEHVAKQLQEALQAAGVEQARAVEIISLARPIVAQRTARMALAFGSTSHTDLSRPSGPGQSRNADQETLRRLIHQAVDLMSVAELREIKIPAGLFQDAARLTWRS